jgi:hypothetical protein
MATPTFDISAAHRWFAIEGNNRAWDWLETGERSPAAALNAIHHAHTSFYHWTQAGTAVHQARAACLLTNVYALAGWGDAARRLAGVAAERLEAAGTDATDWDRAFTVDAASRAAQAAGLVPEAQALRQEAERLGQAIAEAADREVFFAWFARQSG